MESLQREIKHAKMINFKQKELSYSLFDQLQQKFPEIKLVRITEGYDTPEDIWVHITMPVDEERELEMRDLAAEISTDMLVNYGHSLLIISGGKQAEQRAA